MKKHMLMSVLLGAICAVTAVAGEGKIVVQKAVYGVPGDENQSRDVKEEVQAMVVGETLSFPVSDMAKGGDPAGGVVKTLHVEYTINGEPLVAEGKDGQSVFFGKPKVVINKAVYGILDDSARTRDVTANVQALLTGETLSLPVSDMAKSGDPAGGVLKTLRVEYTVKGENFVASNTDGQSVLIGKPKLLIKKAVYGVLDDPARTRDVTASVQSLMGGESVALPVATMAKWGDPAPNVVKTLRVEYVIDGKTLTASGTDPETINLGATAAK